MAVPLDIQEYLVEKVKEQDETFELREGSVFVDFFIKPLILILQPIRNEIETVRFLQSLENFELMSEEDLDALLANIFLTRLTGTKTSGTVRLFFSAPQAASVAQNSAAITATGLRFLANADTAITESAMSVNTDGALYYLDVPVTAEAPGEEYNISQGEIITLEVPVSGVVRVTNLSAFSGGLATESNLEFYNRGQTAVTVRNLINDRSIPTVLYEQFPFIKSITPIGFNDPEMGRARLEILLPGPPQHTVVIPDRGGHADVYIEGDVFVDRSTSLTSVPQIISTNTTRGIVTELDFGYRVISVKGGFFNGLEYPGDTNVQLLPNQYYTLYLELHPTGDKWQLGTVTDLAAYQPVPSGGIALANLRTDGGSVVELIDIRTNIFSFDRPVISLDSAELLDPISLQPTGVVLRDGQTALIEPSIVADPGSRPHMYQSRASGDLHFVFKKSDGVYYQRLDSIGNVVQAETQISSDVNATNLRVLPNPQEDLNVFFLDFSGNVRHLKIDNTGGSLVAENTVSGAGVTSEFEAAVNSRGHVDLVTINNNAGQPDPYLIRTDEDGTVTTAQVLLESTAGTASSPSIAFAPTALGLEISGAAADEGTAGVTSGLPDGIFTDVNADFNASGAVAGTDAVLAGDFLVLIEGTGLPTSEQGAYEIATVDAGGTFVTLTGTPTITAATGVRYEIVRGDGDRCVAWSDDISTSRQVRTSVFDTAGASLLSSQSIVLSNPPDGLDNAQAVVLADREDTSFRFLWVRNQTEIIYSELDDIPGSTISTTGDTQGTGLTRVFLDASNPFLPTDVGRYLSIFSGTGLTPDDFRMYQILEYVSAGQVLLESSVTDSTAADIAYAVVTVNDTNTELVPNFFLNPITDLTAVIDSSNQLHVALIETEENHGRTYLGKFNEIYLPLFRNALNRLSSSVNNRSSISLQVDAIRQPYVVWDDFSASTSRVQIAKYQAQEFAYVVNKPPESFSTKEDASIILDPTLVGQAIRFNYTHSERVPEVDAYVNSTVNRVVIGNYCVRHTLPAYVDVAIEYSGDNAPDETTAQQLLVDYINSIGSQADVPSVTAVVTQSTVGDELEKSDLLDILYDNGADSARVGSEILVDETIQDATIRTQRSIDRVVIGRISRFVARNITVTRV